MACCGVLPKKDWAQTIENVSENFTDLQKKFNISITNMVHIIMDHVGDYIMESGLGLAKVSDQTVEASHSAVNKRLTSSNYWIKDNKSEKHGNMLYRGILHFNAYSI